MKILVSRSIVFVAFALMLTSLMGAHSVYALDLGKIKSLTELQLLSEDVFNEQTNLIEEVPGDDETLEFKVRIPRTWSVVEAEQKQSDESLINTLPKGLIGKIVEYVSPPKNYMRSRFTVETIGLPYEISAHNWFTNYVLKNSLSIEQIGLDQQDRIEAIYIEVEGDITYVVRLKAIISGNRMVLAKYFLPVELYDEEKVLQAQVIDSFELVNRLDTNVEELKPHSFLGQSYFDYPASWILNAPKVRSINRMNAMLLRYNETDLLMGQINIFLSSKTMGTSRSEELKHYREKFNIPNYAIGSLIEKPEMEFDSDMTFGTTQVYSMQSQTPDLIDYELWVSVFENDKYYYITSLLTPSRDEGFYDWARNIQTYKVVLRNVRHKDNNLDPYDYMQ